MLFLNFVHSSVTYQKENFQNEKDNLFIEMLLIGICHQGFVRVRNEFLNESQRPYVYHI